MILHRTCKQAAALLVAREDRPLRLADKVALRIHLALCAACPVFANQLLTLRHALKRWRHAAGAETPPS